MTKKNKATSVNQILLGDSLGELADRLYTKGYEPVKLILIGVDKDGIVMLQSNATTQAELIGILYLTIERVSRY